MFMVLSSVHDSVIYLFIKNNNVNNDNNIICHTVGGWKPEGHKPIKAGSKKK